MRDLAFGRLLRLLRMRRGWRLADLAARSRMSTSALARHEAGTLRRLDSVRRHAAARDVNVELQARGRGADLDRIRDEEHAAIENVLAKALRVAGWTAPAEVSFSEWGERGRVDLLAARTDAGRHRLAAVEVKTDLGDLQELLGALDAKERLTPAIAGHLGWHVGEVSSVLAIAATDRNRQLVRCHAALFAAFTQRTFRGGDPCSSAGRSILWVPAAAAGRHTWLAGMRRVRRVRRVRRSATPSAMPRR
ncbi:MAG TPA: helix-turn-helix domain-containing protein [Candidatus Limnocylindria bacterium]